MPTENQQQQGGQGGSQGQQEGGQGGQTQTSTPATTFDAWLASQGDDVRNLLGEHTRGLKSALDSEREQQDVRAATAGCGCEGRGGVGCAQATG